MRTGATVTGGRGCGVAFSLTTLRTTGSAHPRFRFEGEVSVMTVSHVTAGRGTRRAGGVTVAGVGAGVGASTVATGLGVSDRGIFVGRPVDVLVCLATGESLVRAGHAAQLVTAWSGRPVVAVTAADSCGPSRPVAARLRLLEPHTSGVVVLPYVRRWRELAVPLSEIGDLLRLPLTDQPRGIRRYATTLAEVRALLDVRSPTAARPIPWRAAPTFTSTTASTTAGAVAGSLR